LLSIIYRSSLVFYLVADKILCKFFLEEFVKVSVLDFSKSIMLSLDKCGSKIFKFNFDLLMLRFSLLRLFVEDLLKPPSA